MKQHMEDYKKKLYTKSSGTETNSIILEMITRQVKYSWRQQFQEKVNLDHTDKVNKGRFCEDSACGWLVFIYPKVRNRLAQCSKC